MSTIAAIATPLGQGGVGMIRVSGENAIDIVDKIFKSVSGTSLTEVPGYTAKYGKIMDEGGNVVDDAVALIFKNPHSYTGEDVVEVTCHGGLFILKLVLGLIFKAGAVPAEPGEFTKRAFLNGKMDLTQAESVMDIISANGRHAAKLAVAAHEGALYKRISAVKNSLVEIAAHLAVWADYPEEDIPQLKVDALKDRLSVSANEIKNLLDGYDSGKVLREGLDTVIVGKPNVGKSTLMNLLSGCERCIVTDIPGTTRDTIEEKIVLGDVILNVCDTAGIRHTNDPIEKIGVLKAKKKIDNADLIIAVFDYSKPLGMDELELLRSFPKDAIKVGIVNKYDLDCSFETEKIKPFLDEVIFMSALKGSGLEDLSQFISNCMDFSKTESSEGVLSTERQRRFVQSAYEALLEAIIALDDFMTLDAVSVSVEFAISELLKLTGERVTDVVVNEVFSKFCVGK